MTTPKKRKTDAELFDALEAEAELERIKDLTEAELDAEIRADGGDPEAMAARGAAFIEKLMRERGLDWETRAAERKAAMDKSVGEWPVFTTMPRSELLSRLNTARNDARFSSPVLSAFRKRSEEDSTDDELRAILEDIEVLRRLHGGDDK